MNGYEVSDALWKRIEPLLPPRENTHPRGGGRKPVEDRKVFNAILFVARTGCQWKALDATGICSGSTAHLRFQADRVNVCFRPKTISHTMKFPRGLPTGTPTVLSS